MRGKNLDICMSSTLSAPFSQTGYGFFPKELYLMDEFKDIVNGLFAKTKCAKRRRFYLYSAFHFIFVKLYALSEGISMHKAANELNDYIIANSKDSDLRFGKPYADGKRARRFVPHQTDVDLFFRELSESDVKLLFGGLLDCYVHKIVKEQVPGRSWLSMVDNTKEPYYGEPDPLKHIGADKLQGTKVAWFFQGISIHSQDIHLFTDFYSLTKGIYRAMDVPEAIAWQKWAKINPKGVVFDREFYRAKLVSELKSIGMPCLFPTKKYAWVQHQMENYLHGWGDFVVGNVFQQSFKQYPHQAAAVVRLVMIGTDSQAAWEVRQKYREGTYNFGKAMRNLKGFFTNYKPWKNKKSWARYLVKEYKRRWNIETGFAMLNKIHESLRERTHTVKLSTYYLRAFLYNWWQSWRLDRKNMGLYHRDYTLTDFKRFSTTEIRDSFL